MGRTGWGRTRNGAKPVSFEGCKSSTATNHSCALINQDTCLLDELENWRSVIQDHSEHGASKKPIDESP